VMLACPLLNLLSHVFCCFMFSNGCNLVFIF
jgi:hypothetical protein